MCNRAVLVQGGLLKFVVFRVKESDVNCMNGVTLSLSDLTYNYNDSTPGNDVQLRGAQGSSAVMPNYLVLVCCVVLLSQCHSSSSIQDVDIWQRSKFNRNIELIKYNN